MSKKKSPNCSPQKLYLGKVYRGRTKYIDPETKQERDYVVVAESKKGVSVAKIKTIKKFDSFGKNADRALVEINHKRYGLPKRSGVDFQRFSNNRMSKKRLDIKDKKVFPEKKAQFSLGSHDLSRAIRHTKAKKKGE